MSENDDIGRATPFIAIGIASFDLLAGVKMCHHWIFDKNQTILENLEDVLKITLVSVHRQKEQTFANISLSTFEILSFGWYLTNGIFFIPTPKRNHFFSVLFVFKSSFIRNDIHQSNALLALTKKFSNNVKSTLLKNDNYSNLDKIVERVQYEAAGLIINTISPSIPYKDISFSFPESFYRNLLTSHIQTQMNTIIETSDLSKVQSIINFLYNFMFPFQRNLSSFDLKPSPIPGLFLQIVKPQELSLDELATCFQSPFTWVRISSNSIYQYLNQNKEQSTTFILASSDCNEQSANRNARVTSKLIQFSSFSDWSINTCQFLSRSQSQAQKRVICERQFHELVDNALTSIALDGRKEEKEIFKQSLKCNVQDEKMMVALGELFTANSNKS